MVPLSRDTNAAAEQVQLEIYRRMPAWRKAALVADGWCSARDLARAGLRHRHPNATPVELQRRLMSLLLGDALAERAFGPDGF